MEIKNMVCPSCGARLNISNEKSGVCEFCKSPYIIDDGIIRIEYSISDEETKRKIGNANVALYKFKEYSKSLILFKELYDKYQDNQEFLLGIILSLTEDFSKKDYSISQSKDVFHYWNLFKAIGKRENIEKYQKEIDKIEEIINNKKEKKKHLKKVIITNFLIIVAFLIISFCLLKYTKPKKKNIKIKLSSSSNIEVDTLIKHKLLDCSILDSDIVNKKLEITFYCENMFQQKVYTFEYDLIDDVAPYVSYDNCNIEEGDKPNYKTCIRVSDSVDGLITDFEVDDSLANLDKKGTTYVDVKAKDSSGNEMKQDVLVTIRKISIDEFTLKIKKGVYRVGGKTKASVTIKSDKLKDRTFKYSSSNTKVATIDNTGTIVFKKPGSTTICATSNYDNEVEDCYYGIDVFAQCKNTYVFNVNPSEGRTLNANEDYCPATYRIYAPSVLNYNSFYYIEIYYTNSFMYDESLTVWKEYSDLSDEGKKYSLGRDSSIVIPKGIKQVKLVKSN